MEATCVSFYHFLFYLDPIYSDATFDIQAQSWLYEPLHTRPPCDNKAPRMLAVKQHVPSIASRGCHQEKENMSHDLITHIFLRECLRKISQNVWGKWHRKFFRWDCLMCNLVPVPTNLPLSDIKWQGLAECQSNVQIVGEKVVGRLGSRTQISAKAKKWAFSDYLFFEHESDISDNEFLPFISECLVWPGDTFLGLVSESWFSGILTRSHPPAWPLAVRFRSGNYLSRLFLHLTDTRWVTGSNLKPFTTVKHWVCISHPSIS